MAFVTIEERRLRRLRLYNAVMGGLHLAQGAVILALANDFSLPVTASFLEGPPGEGPGTQDVLFDVRVAFGVAAFLFLSALAHWITVLPGMFEWYGRNLAANRNYIRWLEYSVSASVMIVLIAMLTGISDVAALGAIFMVNAAMIFFGLIMEHYESPGSPNWLAFLLGSLFGIVPWLLIGLYIWSPTTDASPPGFVYAIFVSLFVFFNVFAVNMVFQYKRVGPWRDYVFGEAVYILLSLTAKSALAWQVFGSTLAGS